jgi:hypothetical protein
MRLLKREGGAVYGSSDLEIAAAEVSREDTPFFLSQSSQEIERLSGDDEKR